MDEIVITRSGCISYRGVGIKEFIANINNEIYPVDIKLFDVSKYNIQKAFILNDFEAKNILGEKGLRNFNRNTLFIISTLKKDFEEEINYYKNNNLRLGLTIGTAFGSLQSISDYELDIFEKGPKKINPMGFGNTVINSPTSRANIWFGLTSQSTTISCGTASSAKAIEFSINQILNNNVDAMICGGAEELNMQTFLGYYLNNYLTDDNNIITYEKDSKGTILSEGCGLILLEKKENAIKRNKEILANITGFSTSFYNSFNNNNFNKKIEAIEKTIINSLNEANLTINDIDLIITQANGIYMFDMIEEKSIINLLQNCDKIIPVLPIKKFVGESIGAAGIFQFIFSSIIKQLDNDILLSYYENGKKNLRNYKKFKINYSNFKKILLLLDSECGNHSSFILNIE